MNAVKQPNRADRIPAASVGRTRRSRRDDMSTASSRGRADNAQPRPEGGVAVPRDQIDLWARKASDLPGVRTELVKRIRAEIEAGTYETPEKLERAVERLLDELTEH
jgi:anti-sigma28 factor (negative regulator of flagellin synthesis)